MKIEKGEKYLCTENVFRFKKGRIYESDADNTLTNLNADTYVIGDRSRFFQPLSCAKWAVKRTPENADVVNKWANENLMKGEVINAYTASDGFIHSTLIWNGGCKRHGSQIHDGYTEISFDTFKEIVGIEEGQYKITAKKNESVENEFSESNKPEQPTEEWQPESENEFSPKWGEQVSGIYEFKDRDGIKSSKTVHGKYLGKSNFRETYYIEYGIEEIAIFEVKTLLPPKTEIPMSEALEIIAQAKGINKEQIKIVE